jgi:hypothetical protein
MTAVPSNIATLAGANVAALPAVTPSMPRGSVLANPQQFKLNLQAAEYFAASDLVPVHYRNKPANCFIAINAAQRLGVDEFYFLGKTFVVGGKLGMAAELFIELVNGSGRFRGPIRFKLHGEGDSRACTASAVLLDGTTVENTVSYAMAKADGWTRNSKWQSLTDQMLQYRAGVFLGRLYAGGAAGGMYTKDELEDIAAASARDVTPSAPQIEQQPQVPERPKAPAKPPLLVNLPDGWDAAQFPRTKTGLKEALDFMAAAVLDGAPVVVEMNAELLAAIETAMPALADEVQALRKAADDALLSDPAETEAEDIDDFPGDLPSRADSGE